MEQDSSAEKLAAYESILMPVLTKVRSAFVKVVNKHEDISIFLEAIKELDDVKKTFNTHSTALTKDAKHGNY